MAGVEGQGFIELSKEKLDLLHQMAMFGVPLPQMAAIIKISKATLERRLKNDPPTREAILGGRAKAVNRATGWLYMHAFGYTDDDGNKVKGDKALAIFWFKTRMGFKEGTTIDYEEEAAKADGKTPVIQWAIRGMENVTEDQVNEMCNQWYDEPNNTSASANGGGGGSTEPASGPEDDE